MQDDGFYRAALEYDRRYGAEAGAAEVAFWRNLAERLGARLVLELGCGSGRLTLPLARWAAATGRRLVGLDLTPAMLEAARAKLAAEPPEVRAAVRLIEGDMRAPVLAEAFDLVFIPFNTFAHLHAIDEQLACLTAARRHLAPGGRLAVDVVSPSVAELQRDVEEAGVTRIDGAAADEATGERLVRYRRTGYDHLTQTSASRFTYEWLTPSGARRIEQADLTLHIFFRRELELLFRLAGYRVETIYGDYGGGTLAAGSPLMIALVAPA